MKTIDQAAESVRAVSGPGRAPLGLTGRMEVLEGWMTQRIAQSVSNQSEAVSRKVSV